jgi:hypothetical protein
MADKPTPPDDAPPDDWPEELRSARDRAQMLLPWAANGTLDAAEQAWLDDWLATTERSHPALVAPLRAELAWLQRTATDVRRSTRLPDPEQGLDTLLRRIADERSAARQTPEAQGSPPPIGLWGRALAWVHGHGPQLAGACAVLVVAQATTLALLGPAGSDLDPLGGGVGVPSVKGTVLLQAAFKPEATEAQIRATLREAKVQIAGGPSAIGLYLLRVKTEDADAAIALLRLRTAAVESVQRLK